MSDFEDLRMTDLLKRFKSDILRIEESRSTSLFKKAGADLQNVYNFHLTSEKSFSEVEEYLKNLYSSFNYSAVIINNALKSGGLTADDNQLLSECIEIMVKCCNAVISILNENK